MFEWFISTSILWKRTGLQGMSVYPAVPNLAASHDVSPQHYSGPISSGENFYNWEVAQGSGLQTCGCLTPAFSHVSPARFRVRNCKLAASQTPLGRGLRCPHWGTGWDHRAQSQLPHVGSCVEKQCIRAHQVLIIEGI